MPWRSLDRSHSPARKMSNRALIVAEIGENHGGDWQLARLMIREAARAGADAVKFQSYLGSDVADSDPEKDWFTRVQLPDLIHFEWKTYAEQCGVEFLSTPFSIGRARFLVEELGLRKMKVASSEMLNFAILDYLNGRVELALLSTGMATEDEIKVAAEDPATRSLRNPSASPAPAPRPPPEPHLFA